MLATPIEAPIDNIAYEALNNINNIHPINNIAFVSYIIYATPMTYARTY